MGRGECFLTGLGRGEYSKLLVAEEVEAELDPGTKLQSVLDSMLRQLSSQGGSRRPRVSRALPPATGSQPKSILSTLTALSGGMKGLTPAQSGADSAALGGRLCGPSFRAATSSSPGAGGGFGFCLCWGEEGGARGGKRAAGEEGGEEGKGETRRPRSECHGRTPKP